jgi:putative ABC transport system permease protein
VSGLESTPAVLMAIRNLDRNRLRSGLAVLGIVIGVIAIATLGIFGNVLQLSATNELGGIGDQVIVSPSTDGGGATLTSREVDTVRRVAEGRGTAVPLLTGGSLVDGPGGQSFARLYGTSDPGALFQAARGTLPDRHRQGAIVGTAIATELNLQVGSVLQIEGNRYRVLTVLASGESISPIQPDSAVILPEGEFAQEGYSQVVVRANSGEDATAVAQGVRERLNARDQRVSVFELGSVLEQIQEFLRLLNGFLVALGAVSLVVAGVAIFNVMLMSTRERRGEIGVLRAVGVRKQDVLRTLVVEAALLGVVGGVVGVSISGLATLGLYQFTPLGLDVVLAPSNGAYLLLAFTFGVLIALLSGLYPAWQAANEQPVEALRD